MDRANIEWLSLNQEAASVIQTACTRMANMSPGDPFIDMSMAFMQKAQQTLVAVNTLYQHELQEPAQSLIRVLFEHRVNFDCFLQMGLTEPRWAVERVIDSMMLEKAKQMRASKMLGIDDDTRRRFDEHEAHTIKKYGKDEFARLRKCGFTGLPMEQRAQQTGHGEAYSIVYRNFSRNIHGTDWVESHLQGRIHNLDPDHSYRHGRDFVAQYTAHFAAVGMLELANHIFELELEDEIRRLGIRQGAIKGQG